MAFIIEPRVKETSTTTGTGALTLDGAVANFSAFSARMVNNDTCPYMIVHQTANEWEGGLATWGTGNILTRTAVWHSSNGDAAVNFSAGTKDVFITVPGRCIPEPSGGLWFNQKAAGQNFLVPFSAFSILQADFTGSNATGNQPFFSSAQDAFTLEAATTYKLEGLISMNRGAGTTSHTTGVNFGGTATFTKAMYNCSCRYGARAAATPVRPYDNEYNGTTPSTNIIVSLASTIAQSKTLRFDGIFVVNAAGTIIPQFQYSAAPGGAPTIERGSWMRFTPLGNASAAVIGAWA